MSSHKVDEWKRDEVPYCLKALDWDDDEHHYRLNWEKDGVNHFTYVPAALGERIAFWREKYKMLARQLGME